MKSERHRKAKRNNVSSAPQFWGPYVYDFPKLKVNWNADPKFQGDSQLPLLFGFNEPDRKTSVGGTSMSVKLAVKYWKLNSESWKLEMRTGN